MTSPRSLAEQILLAVVFLAYAAVVFVGAAVHEPWWDEAQAWLIARDAPMVELFTRDLAYEGHPPLWYLVLAVPARLGFPYGALKVVAALAAGIGVFLLLFRADRVPLVVRVLVPFTYFIAYQYTVVARSYVLMAPLLIGIALLYDARAQRFRTFVTLLVLLAHVAVHAFAIACAFMLLCAADVFRKRLVLTRRQIIGGSLAFGANALALVAILWPPGDLASRADLHSPLSPGRLGSLVSWLAREVFWSGPTSTSLALTILHVLATTATFAVLVFWFRKRGVLLVYLVLTLSAFAVATLYASAWHEGIFVILLLFAIVLAFSRTAERGLLDTAALILIIGLFVRSAQWTWNSVRYDMQYEFTGSQRAAEFIAANRLDERKLFGMGVRTVELQPYFPSNVFDNYANGGKAFWNWSTANSWPYPTAGAERAMGRWYREMLSKNPDAIVVSLGFRNDYLYARALAHDPRYRLAGTFAGRTYWKYAPAELIAFQVYVPVNTNVPPAR